MAGLPLKAVKYLGSGEGLLFGLVNVLAGYSTCWQGSAQVVFSRGGEVLTLTTESNNSDLLLVLLASSYLG